MVLKILKLSSKDFIKNKIYYKKLRGENNDNYNLLDICFFIVKDINFFLIILLRMDLKYKK